MNTTPKITIADIQLKPWISQRGRIAGGREVHISGAVWAFVRMEGHGVHGPTFELYHPSVSERGATSGAVYLKSENGNRIHARTHALADIPAKVLEAIEQGAIEPPGIRLARIAALRGKLEAEREAAERDRQRMRAALIAAYGRATDLSERVGLNDAFKDIFHSNIPEEGEAS